MENEIMNNVEVVEDVVETVYEEGRECGFGAGMILGGVLMAAGIAVSKWVKKKVADHKAKKTEGVLKFEDIEKQRAQEDEEVTVE